MIERKSTLRHGLLAGYRNPVFIETGTYDGSGCLIAVAVGFKRVISIEIAPRLYEFSKDRLKNYPQIELHLGDSAKVLPGILADLHERATFWIDAHQPQDGTAHVSDWNVTPVMQELRVIAQHKIKDHTILIDDRDLLGTEHMDFLTEDALKARLREINEAYEFSYADGNKPGSVLIATPP